MAAASIVRSVDVLQIKSIDAWPRYCVMLLSDRVSTTDNMPDNLHTRGALIRTYLSPLMLGGPYVRRPKYVHDFITIRSAHMTGVGAEGHAFGTQIKEMLHFSSRCSNLRYEISSS